MDMDVTEAINFANPDDPGFHELIKYRMYNVWAAKEYAQHFLQMSETDADAYAKQWLDTQPSIPETPKVRRW